MSADLTAAMARRIVVHAQGFENDDQAPQDVLAKLGLLQLDPLARVEKAHRLSVLARSRGHLPEDVDNRLWTHPAAVAFETYTHAACLIPVEAWPLFRLKRVAAAKREDTPEALFMEQVLTLVADSPTGLTLRQIEGSSPPTSGWNWSPHKRAAEHLVWRGDLAVTERRLGRRVFNLPSRTIPAAHLNLKLDREEILAGFARRAVESLGIVTPADLAAHYHVRIEDAQTGLALSGHERLTVEGWQEPAWLSADSLNLQESTAPQTRLLGPFDNLIRDRNRLRRIFGFDYIFEAYKPASKRQYGHYVLALLDNDELVGRVDARKDKGTLIFDGTYPESRIPLVKFESALQTAGEHLATQLSVTWN